MNRLHTLFAHKKHPLRLRLLCTGLCCAFLFAGGYYAARHLLNAYWPSLGAAFADNGLTLRAFCAAAAAVLPASLLAYAFYYTAQQHRHAYAVAQTLLAGCISGTAVACVTTACFALGTLYSALLAIAGCLLGFAACLGIFYIWKNRKAAQSSFFRPKNAIFLPAEAILPCFCTHRWLRLRRFAAMLLCIADRSGTFSACRNNRLWLFTRVFAYPPPCAPVCLADLVFAFHFVAVAVEKRLGRRRRFTLAQLCYDGSQLL